jgi:hypothetical protein
MRTLISGYLNNLLPPSISYQAQSPYLPYYGGVDVRFSGAVDCFQQIVKAQGVLGLWNGLTANLLKVRGVTILLLLCLFQFYPFPLSPTTVEFLWKHPIYHAIKP